MSSADLLVLPSVHADLRRMVRRRVPERDVEDVVQQVLCEALAGQPPAASTVDVTRWLMAIARNKVADYYRRAEREPVPADIEPAPATEPVEERDLLRAVERSLAEDERGLETFRWIVREWSGESLASIATSHRLPAEVVRQRVSRLRRRLRYAFAAAIGTGALAAALFAASRPADPLRPRFGAPLPAAAAPSLDGDWSVVALESAASLPDAQRAAVFATRLEIRGGRVDVVTPKGKESGVVELRRDGDQLVGSVLLERGEIAFSATVDGDRMAIETSWGGGTVRATLARY